MSGKVPLLIVERFEPYFPAKPGSRWSPSFITNGGVNKKNAAPLKGMGQGIP